MSELFDINLNYLKQYREALYEQVKSQLDKPSQYTVVLAENGSPNIEIKQNQVRSSYMYSRYNPEHECTRWSESLQDDVDSEADVIMYGVGLTHHVAAYLTRYSKHQLYLYEPNIEVFIESLKVISLADLLAHKNIRYLAVGEQESELGGLFYNYYTYAFSMQDVVALPYYVNGNPDQYKQFHEIMKKYVYNLVSEEQYIKGGGFFLQRNIFRNISKVLQTPSLRNLKNIWNGKSVIIVGGGPSLEKDISLLTKYADRYIIIAAGTSIQALMKHNIQPHLVVTMDAFTMNYEAFAKVDLTHIPLLFIPTVEYRIPMLPSAVTIHAFFEHVKEYKYLLDLDEEDPLFIGSHSVTGTAIQAAIYMGAKQVIFTGQDLSYPGQSIYAAGTTHLPETDLDKIKNDMTEIVKNVNNTYNATTIKMNMTLQDIEDLIKKYDNVEFINCSQGGAKIKGTTYSLLNDLNIPSYSYTREHFIEEISKQVQVYDNKLISNVEERLVEQKQWLFQSLEKLKSIQVYLNKIEVISRTNQNKCFNNIAEIQELWGSIVFHEQFAILLESLLVKSLKHLDRMVPHIQTEQRIINKAKMLREALEPVVSECINEVKFAIICINVSLEGISLYTLTKEGSVNDQSYRE